VSGELGLQGGYVERRVLASAASGGHFKQLVSLVTRLPRVGEVTWVTYDAGLSADLLAAAGRSGERLVYVPYAAPRDVPNLLRDAAAIRRLVREARYDLAMSTGPGIAVATLPVARAHGIRACFIESATRAGGPSLAGRILQRTPGVELYAQHPGYGSAWGSVGSVHDEFEAGPHRTVTGIDRLVVTVGTIRPFGFRRLIERLLTIIPESAEVLWQTGSTDVSDLPIEGRKSVPGSELRVAMEQADVVVAHAGTGTALTAFELGVSPLLVPRRSDHGEHVDDHQVETARYLARRGLATYAEVSELTPRDLHDAARRSVHRRTVAPEIDL
jgi:UDP-N-acetylglucosamine--N-acetylmuramyl-(pentapeptide) pyrophosphoryl-undecaprenol N-acetylglucosamine transferase